MAKILDMAGKELPTVADKPMTFAVIVAGVVPVGADLREFAAWVVSCVSSNESLIHRRCNGVGIYGESDPDVLVAALTGNAAPPTVQ